MRPCLVACTLTIAASLYGVTGCAARTVNPQLINDALTTARIRTVLVNDRQLGARPVDIRVTAGVAYLSGEQFTAEEAARLEQIVRTVEGVHDVKATIRLAAPPCGQVPCVALTHHRPRWSQCRAS